MSKLTPWFPPEVKPVRVGVYEAKEIDGPPWFRFWDGKKWGVGDTTPDGAIISAKTFGKTLFVSEWRGLTREAK